jgi:hypothetical protein
MKLQFEFEFGIQNVLQVFRFEFEFKFWGIIKRFSKSNLVNQEWHLVKHVMLDSMMPLDAAVITK